ncbi:MAG: hypothetical protein WC308_01935 [archaeon]|jgi:hypothetical protein
MDIFTIAGTAIDFLKLLVPLGVIGFIAYKLGQPILEKLTGKHSLSWVKACIILNFVVAFAWLFFFYIYFILIGAATGAPVDQDSQLTMLENLGVILFDSIRIAVSAITIALALLIFEFVASLIISMQKKNKYSVLLKQLIGVFGAAALFLVLILFFFDWVILGLFIFTFYGKIRALPLLVISFLGAVL